MMSWDSLIFFGALAALFVFDRLMRHREMRMIIAGIKARDAVDFTRSVDKPVEKKSKPEPTTQDLAG